MYERLRDAYNEDLGTQLGGYKKYFTGLHILSYRMNIP